MERLIDRTYRAIRFVIDWIIGYSAAVVMLGATCFAIVEIIRRYMFGVVFHWGQDAVTYLIAGSVFFFFAVTQARRSHLAMTAGIELLRAKGFVRTVLAIRVFVTSVSLAMFSAIAWWGIPTVERTMMMGRTTQSMILPLWPFQAAMLIGFGLMALVTLFHLYQDIQALRGKTVFPWAPVEEGLEV
ncbi:MAG: TRAP transporter small permease [Alphaproteobacteria bacterium]